MFTLTQNFQMDTMMTVMKEMKGEIDGLKASAEDARLRAYRAEERTMEALAEYDKEKRRADDADAALKDLRLSTDKKPLSWGNDVDMTHTPAKVPFTPVRRWPAPPPLPNPQKPHTVIDLDDSSDDDMNVDRSILLPKPQLQPQHRIATPGPSTTPTTTPPTRHNIPTSQPASRSVHFTSLKGKEPELQRPLTPTSMPKVTGKPKDTSNPRVRSSFRYNASIILMGIRHLLSQSQLFPVEPERFVKQVFRHHGHQDCKQ